MHSALFDHHPLHAVPAAPPASTRKQAMARRARARTVRAHSELPVRAHRPGSGVGGGLGNDTPQGPFSHERERERERERGLRWDAHRSADDVHALAATSGTSTNSAALPTGWVVVRQQRHRLVAVVGSRQRQRLWLRVTMSAVELARAPGAAALHVLALHTLTVAVRRGFLSLRAPGLRMLVEPEDPSALESWGAALGRVTGRRFSDHYRLGAELARGSFATVHRATHLASGTSCAVKVISTTAKRAQTAIQLAAEARAMAHFGSVPGLMGAREVFHERSAVYIVMELYRGGSLKEQVCDHAPYGASERIAAGVALKLARALAVMHADGVAHRDVKLENCLCRDSTFPPSDVVLADFGFAVFMDETPAAKRSYAVGTPVYVAPEAARSEPHGTEVDVYALGVLVYRMMASEYPVEGRDDRETLRMMAGSKVEVRYEKTVLKDASKECLGFLRSCLQWDPRKRISARGALVHPWLAQAHADEMAQVGLPARPEPSTKREIARRRWKNAALAIRFVSRLSARADAAGVHRREYSSWTAEVLSDRLKRVSVGKENAFAAISSVSKRTGSKLESVVRFRSNNKSSSTPTPTAADKLTPP